MTTRIHQLSPYAGRWSTRPSAVGTSLGSVFQEFDQLLQPRTVESRAAGLGSYHPIDLYETADAVVLEMVVPGVKADDLDINIEGRKLVITGSSKRGATVTGTDEVQDNVGAEGSAGTPGSDKRYWLKDIAYGDFSRTVKVPRGVDVEAIDANLDDGILRLTMPKAPEALSRKIAIGNGAASEVGSEPASPITVDAKEDAG